MNRIAIAALALLFLGTQSHAEKKTYPLALVLGGSAGMVAGAGMSLAGVKDSIKTSLVVRCPQFQLSARFDLPVQARNSHVELQPFEARLERHYGGGGNSRFSRGLGRLRPFRPLINE